MDLHVKELSPWDKGGEKCVHSTTCRLTITFLEGEKMLDSLNLGILFKWSYLRGKRKCTECVSRRTTDLARNGIFILTRKAHMHDAGHFRTRTPPQRIQRFHTLLVMEGLDKFGPRKQCLVGIWTKISCPSPPLLPPLLARLLAAIICHLTTLVTRFAHARRHTRGFVNPDEINSLHNLVVVPSFYLPYCTLLQWARMGCKAPDDSRADGFRAN